jgi:hypothetical protein
MKVGTRVDQPRKDRIGAPEKLPRLGIGDRVGLPPRLSIAYALRALGSGGAGRRVCVGLQRHSFKQPPVRHDIDDR